MDKDLKEILNAINSNVILARRGMPWWRSLIHGVMTGLGSIIGIIVALAVLGWILNIVGVIPAFQSETNQWKDLLQKAQQQRLPGTSAE